MSKAATLVRNSVLRQPRILTFLYDDLLTTSTRAHSSLPRSHPPSLRALQSPYPDLSSLNNSIFESAQFQDKRVERSILYETASLTKAIEDRDFVRAEGLRDDYLRAGIDIEPSTVYLDGLEGSVARAGPSKRLAVFLAWIPFIPVQLVRSTNIAVRTGKILRWCIGKIYEVNSKTEELELAAIRLLHYGHADFVFRSIFPMIVRTTSPGTSIKLFERFRDNALPQHQHENTGKESVRHCATTIYSSAILTYTIAGYLKTAVELVRRSYEDRIEPNFFIVRRLEEELQASDSKESLSTLTGLQIRHLCGRHKVHQAVRKLVHAHINSIEIPKRDLLLLRQETRTSRATKHEHNVVHAIDRALREGRDSVADFRKHLKSPKPTSDTTQDLSSADPGHPLITINSLQEVSRYLRHHLKRPRHRISVIYAAQFIETCEAVSKISLLDSFRQDFRPAFLPARTFWITAEMACRWRRKDYLGVLEIYRNHFIGDYGVSQDLIDRFLQHYYSLPGPSRTNASALEFSDHKTFPSTYSQGLVWASLCRLTYDWTEYPLTKLYGEFLLTVRESQGFPRPTETFARQPTLPLPPATRLDASHFAPFIRAFGSKWHAERCLRVVQDMKAYGIRPTLRIWTLVMRMFARGQFKDAMRANRILGRAREGLAGVLVRRTRIPCEPREPAVADKVMYRVALEAHVRKKRRKAAWEVYYELRKMGYQLGSDRLVDTVILDLFRLGRVRPGKRKLAGAKRVFGRTSLFTFT